MGIETQADLNFNVSDYLRPHQTENLMAEIQLLRSQNRELLVSNSEKDKQIRLYQKQVSVVRRALALTKKKPAVAAAAQSVSSEAPKRKNSTEDSSGGGAAVLQQNPTLNSLRSQDTSITRRYGY